ncbi:MAG: amino acid adenylation domain-containing protein [Rhizonema sp. PD37]|nr:amino acid adenylation domain-containing protein [Rhizonema sp. PD37]
MSDLLERLYKLSPEKRKLALKKLQSQNLISEINNGSQTPPIVPVAREQAIPLSFAQARLWFLDQLDKDSFDYKVPNLWQLTGFLQVAALEQAIAQIVQRHEVLRTTFAIVDGSPVQVINPNLTVTLPVIDLEHLPVEEQFSEVRQLVTKEAQRPFDLANDPLLRLLLLRLSNESHMLLLVMHHIVCDGWSMGIFVRELSTLYTAFYAGELSPLPKLPVQYADFAYWQRQWLSGEVYEAKLNYWQQQLAEIPPLLELPTDRPRPPVQTFRGSAEYCEINRELTQKLKCLSQQSGSTLFMTLLAAFALLLSRYSNQEEIVVGSPIANRNHREIAPLIGFFVNTLVLRTNLQGNPSFLELLDRVRQMALDAYAHQDLPFEKLVEELHPERSLSYHPLFQVMFALQNAPMGDLQLPGLNLSLLKWEYTTVQFDLALTIKETEQKLIAEWEYNSDLFDTATIVQIMAHFQTLLESIVANPEQPVVALPWLTKTEKHQLLIEWNDNQITYPADSCIHQIFEQQVERSPDSVAVMLENAQLTYRELNSRANQLAHYLQTLGVGSEVLVGICVERSLEMIVGLLGVLKAGGAYVPLDPVYPQERLAHMLNDSQISVLLTQRQLLESLPKNQAQVIFLDTGWKVISTESEENPATSVKPSNLAYVIYTSGSTGKPKGVMIEHRSVVNFTAAMKIAYELNSSDRILQFSSISFDMAVDEIYNCLTCGGTLVLRTNEMLNSVSTFVQKCREWKLTVLQPPTAYWHQLTSELATTNEILPISVRLVIIGGEQVLPEKLKLWRKCVDDRLRSHKLGKPPLLINGYGPSEATVQVTTCKLSELVAENTQLQLPIGRPISNVQTYILDKYLQPVPIGIAGELYIGGVCLARGYFNYPELTAEKFIQNPFQNSRGEKEDQSSNSDRLYKTGDLARYLPDGNIEFLGRSDTQVKIRGFRIELGEIEAILSQHPQVQETTVIVREDNPGNKRLVGYIVAKQKPPRTDQLRRFLKQKLPDYMVPSAFVMLDALPVTVNNKVDHRALPTPDSGLSIKASFIAPRNSLELQLLQVWEEVLNVHPIGVRDNFFDLGGHSLLAISLMARIQQQFGKNLPLVLLFQQATVEHLSSFLREQTDSPSWSTLVPLQPKGSKRPFFCIHPGGGTVLWYRDLARHLSPDQPFYGLESQGLDEQQKPHDRVEDMAADYIQAIQTVQPQGPYQIGGWCFGGLVAFEMAHQLQTQGQQVSFLGLIDTDALMTKEEYQELDDVTWFVRLFAPHNPHLLDCMDRIQQFAPDEQLSYLIEQAKYTTQLLPPDFGLAQARRLLEVAKGHVRAGCSYNLKIYAGKLTLFQAIEGEAASCKDPTLGWGEFTSDGFDIHWVPGNHKTMVKEPHVQVLAEQLRACLEQ